MEKSNKRAIRRKLLLLPDLSTLCMHNIGVQSSLEVRGILNLRQLRDLNPRDIKAFGLADLVVRRRLIDYIGERSLARVLPIG